MFFIIDFSFKVFGCQTQAQTISEHCFFTNVQDQKNIHSVLISLCTLCFVLCSQLFPDLSAPVWFSLASCDGGRDQNTFAVPGFVLGKLIFVVRTAQILHITFESVEQDFTLNWTQTYHRTPNFTFTGGKGTLW